MKDLEYYLNLPCEDLAGLSFICPDCGNLHRVDINKILIGKGVINRLPEVIKEFEGKRIFTVADRNTDKVAGETVSRLLKEKGFDEYKFVFKQEEDLNPDAGTLGRLLIEYKPGTDLIVGVGSGVINDMSRFLAYKVGIPFVIVGTAPSMDGYASVVTPTVVDGIKATLDGIYPYAIIGDTDILKGAPDEMLHAGFGDILGKVNALCDWNLARNLKGEGYCELCAGFVKNALKKCVENLDGIRNRDEQAIKYLMEALVIAGVSMGMYGNSRPASGAEHHFAHFWDEDAISKNKSHPLHGNSVGVGTVVAAEQYELIKHKISFDLEFPDPEEVLNLLSRLGACTGPKELGIEREVFAQSIIHSKDTRDKFTSSHFAGELGMLEEISKILTKKFYDEKD